MVGESCESSRCWCPQAPTLHLSSSRDTRTRHMPHLQHSKAVLWKGTVPLPPNLLPYRPLWHPGGLQKTILGSWMLLSRRQWVLFCWFESQQLSEQRDAGWGRNAGQGASKGPGPSLPGCQHISALLLWTLPGTSARLCQQGHAFATATTALATRPFCSHWSWGKSHQKNV